MLEDVHQFAVRAAPGGHFRVCMGAWVRSHVSFHALNDSGMVSIRPDVELTDREGFRYRGRASVAGRKYLPLRG